MFIWANFVEKQLAFAIIPHTSTQVRAARRPSRCDCRFGFFITLNKKITRISRELLNVTHVFQRCLHIKKYRLIFWIHRIKRLIQRNESINFRRGLLHLLPVSQDCRREWITNPSNYESNCDKKRNYFCPCTLVRHPCFPGPLQPMRCVAPRQQPRSWSDDRHAISGHRTRNEVYSEKWDRYPPRESTREPLLGVIVKL